MPVRLAEGMPREWQRPIGSMLQIPLPEHRRIPSARGFFRIGQNLTLPAGVGGQVSGPSFQVPTGAVGVLDLVSIFVSAPTAAALMEFSVTINDMPISVLNGYSFFAGGGVAYLVENFNDVQERISQGALVKSFVTNQSALAWTVGIRFGGSFWPRSDGEMYSGQPWVNTL